MIIHYFILIFCFISQSIALEAPTVLIDYQQNPTEISWSKIDTEHFEIIFPTVVEGKAQKVAQLLETAYPFVSRSLEVLPPKISIVLQNQSTISNGFVTLAPRRSELFLTPSVDPELTNTEWLKTLAIHEFRHIVQFEKSRQSVNKVFEVFLGEIGQALGIGLTMPPWLLEGDAVGIETALTPGGRGRLPLFERDLRTLLLSGKKFNYDKAHLGSFKDYVPNHYLYGYFYTTFLRNNHGDLILSKLIDRATKRSFNPLSFYNSYRFHTGQNFDDFYAETTRELIKLWQEKLDKLPVSPFKVKSLNLSEDWINYLYPQVSTKGEILALKKGLSYIPQFVLFKDDQEKTLFYPGMLNQEYPYKLRNDRFAFIEWELDPRWGVKDFSKIKVYDLKKNKVISEFSQTKARLAVLNHTGELISYIDWSTHQNQRIIVKKIDGTAVFEIDYPTERVITSLDWQNDQEIVMVVKDNYDQKSIVRFHLLNKSEDILIPASITNYGALAVEAGKILVESPESGIDNIYEVTAQGLRQITSSKFGAYAPTISNSGLIYNNYSVNGMEIASRDEEWSHPAPSNDSFIPFYKKFSSFEEREKFEKELKENVSFPVEKYFQTKNAINLHSWFLLAPPLSTEVTLMGMSRDILNKFTLAFGANYNLNEKVADAFVSAAWSHYYPVIDLRAAFGSRHQVLELNNQEFDDYWQESTLESGLQLPWKKISGRFLHQLQLRSFAKIIQVTGKNETSTSELTHGEIFSPGLEIQFSSQSRKAQRDLNPEWGFNLLAHSEEGRDISGDQTSGSLLSLETKYYIPGFFKHHSFNHQVAYEHQNSRDYQYKSLILNPRGTDTIFLDEFRKYSANYLMPLFYPEWQLSRYAYLKRLSLNLFFDEALGRYQTSENYRASTGWELLFDSHFFRIFIPFTLGVRGSYLLTGDKQDHYEVFVTTMGGSF